MPPLFWAVFAGLAILVVAVALNVLFGRGLAQTRAALVNLQRRLEATRRLNDDVIAAAIKDSLQIDIVKADNAESSKSLHYRSWLDR
jgi:hypothetical protein